MMDWPQLRRWVYLRVLRWRILHRNGDLAYLNTSVVTVFLGITIALIWRHFGTEKCLPVLADLTPILLAIVGVVMSYIQPSKDRHLITTCVLVVAGLAGTIVLSANRIKGEASHRLEISGLNQKLDSVGAQNTSLGNFLVGLNGSGRITESERMHGIEASLRSEYILLSNPIDQDILAGSKMPPADWMNRRLHELGETWTVSETPRTTSAGKTEVIQQLPLPVKKVDMIFSLWQNNISAMDKKTTEDVVMKDGTYEFSIGAVVVGEESAENLQVWIRACDGCLWDGQPPAGFGAIDPDKPWDRTVWFSTLMPNVSTPKMTFKIRPRAFPKQNGVIIACYFACKNCPPVDWNKPQVLTVKNPGVPMHIPPSFSFMPGKPH